jgi:hypothetical protein
VTSATIASSIGTVGDLAHYTPGDHGTVFDVGGVRCGALICYEYRFPELYREYQRQGVQLVFRSFHAGHANPRRWARMKKQVGAEAHKLNPGSTLPEITMPAAMHAAAANNYIWISCSNTSAKESCWPSFFTRPDGVVTGKLRRNVPGVLISDVDPRKKYYDSTLVWRERAMRGVFHSGTLIRDPRSALGGSNETLSSCHAGASTRRRNGGAAASQSKHCSSLSAFGALMAQS